MKVDIYRSNKAPNKVLYVPEGTDISGDNLGLGDADFEEVHLLKKSVELQPGLIGVNVKIVSADIAAKGYSIGGVKITITEQKK